MEHVTTENISERLQMEKTLTDTIQDNNYLAREKNLKKIFNLISKRRRKRGRPEPDGKMGSARLRAEDT